MYDTYRVYARSTDYIAPYKHNKHKDKEINNYYSPCLICKIEYVFEDACACVCVCVCNM